MAVSLDPILQTALDGETRNLALAATAEPRDDTLPLVGQQLHNVSENENNPSGFKHSDGGYIGVYAREDVTGTGAGGATDETHLYLKISTDDRINWEDPVKFTLTGPGFRNEHPSIVELSTNDIGVVYSEQNISSGLRKLKYLVLDKLGNIVTAATDIDASGDFYEASVAKLTDDSYLLIAARDNSGTWELRRYSHASGNWPTPSTWTSHGVLGTISGEPGGGTSQRRRPSLQEIEVAGGGKEQWLFYDRVDETSGTSLRTNVYYVNSTTSLADGSFTATAVTSHSLIGKSGEDPSFVQHTVNSLTVGYTFRQGSIKIDTNSSPALDDDDADFIWYDEGNDWIVMVDRGQTGASAIASSGIVVLNAVDFSLEKQYNESSSLPTGPLRDNFAYYFSPWVILCHPSTLTPHINDPWIEAYDIRNNSRVRFYRDTATITADPARGDFKVTNMGSANKPIAIATDGSDIYFVSNPPGKLSLWKMPLVPNQATFDAAQIGGDIVVGGVDGNKVPGARQKFTYWDFNTNSLYYCFFQTAGASVTSKHGFVAQVNLADGAVLNIWRNEAHGDSNEIILGAICPKQGFKSIWVDGDYIFAAASDFEATYPAGSTGLIVIDKSVPGVVNFTGEPIGPVRASGVPLSFNEQLRFARARGDGKVMLCTRTNGLGIYDAGSNTVEKIYNDTNILGMPTIPGGQIVTIADAVFDPARNRYYLAHDKGELSQITGGGILAFDADGDILQIFFKIISNLFTTPAQSAEALLCVGTDESMLGLMVNGTDDGLAAFWSRRVGLGTEQDLMFGEEVSGFDLLPYLHGEFTTDQSLEHAPNSLSFVVARGDLFDVTNQKSLLRQRLDFGSKVKFRKGEVVDGTTYLQDMFVGFVDSSSMVYSKQGPRLRNVVCFDGFKPCFDYRVAVTPSYGTDAPSFPDGNDPDEGIIAHAAVNLCGFKETELDLGINWQDRTSIVFQLVDVSPADLLQLVSNRFKRVLYVNNSGLLTSKRIEADLVEDDPVLDYIVASSDRIVISYNPSENEGELVNRVTVRGVTNDQIEAQFPEQLMLEHSGTAGWIQNPSDVEYVPYSPTLNIEAIRPRLVPVTIPDGKKPTVVPYTSRTAIAERGSVKDADAQFDQMTDSEFADFLNRRGVRVKLHMFDFWKKVIAKNIQFIQLIAIFFVLVGVAAGISSIPVIGSIFGGIAVSAALTALGVALAVLQVFQSFLIKLFFYSFQIYALPRGLTRQEIQCSSTDEDFRQKLDGRIVERTTDFPFATTVSICCFMADWFLLRIKIARNPFRISRLGHMRPEPGDIIFYDHPASGQKTKGLIHAIKRTVNRGNTDREDITVLPMSDV